MKLPTIFQRAALLLAALAVLAGVPAVSTAAAATASAGTGWIRLAHLSPDTPAMDVYLYSYGNPGARVVLHHVAYGNVSSYQSVPAGEYSVAMRPAGMAATSQPVLSASTWVVAGHAYTAAAVGPRAGLRLQILHDDLTTPAGKALVRVVQASLRQNQVTVRWNGKTIASRLSFPAVTSYQAVPPGTQHVAVTAGSADAKSAVTLTAGTIHTLVVLDGAKGLEIANLQDAAGSSQMPAGGAQTGFGGTAPHGPSSPLPWLEVIGAGSLLAMAGGLELRRHRRGPGQHRHRDGGRPLSPRA